MAHTVLITDPVDAVCTDMLEEQGFEVDLLLDYDEETLREHVATANGWIVRSGTQVTAELIDIAEELQVVGRAGVGVDNIDLDAATRKGVLVCNAPDGNTISTAEHTTAMMQTLARNRLQKSGLPHPIGPQNTDNRAHGQFRHGNIRQHPVLAVMQGQSIDTQSGHQPLRLWVINSPRNSGMPINAVTMPSGTRTPGTNVLLQIDADTRMKAPASALPGR